MRPFFAVPIFAVLLPGPLRTLTASLQLTIVTLVPSAVLSTVVLLRSVGFVSAAAKLPLRSCTGSSLDANAADGASASNTAAASRKPIIRFIIICLLAMKLPFIQ